MKNQTDPHNLKHAKDDGRAEGGNKPKGSMFSRFAKTTSSYAGKPVTFGIAILAIVVWACSGPLFGYSDTWQLVINTSTTIITFLMVFLIQNSQNRDSAALQIKLDELIRVQKLGNNALMDLEELSDEDLDKIRKSFIDLAEKKRGLGDVTAAAVDGSSADA